MPSDEPHKILSRLRDDKEFRDARQREDRLQPSNPADSDGFWSFSRAAFHWFTLWVAGKAYYSFCFAIAALGAGMITTSIYDLLGQLALKYLEVELPRQTTVEFLIEKLVGVALIALGVYLAYRHRHQQKQNPELPKSGS